MVDAIGRAPGTPPGIVVRYRGKNLEWKGYDPNQPRDNHGRFGSRQGHTPSEVAYKPPSSLLLGKLSSAFSDAENLLGGKRFLSPEEAEDLVPVVYSDRSKQGGLFLQRVTGPGGEWGVEVYDGKNALLLGIRGLTEPEAKDLSLQVRGALGQPAMNETGIKSSGTVTQAKPSKPPSKTETSHQGVEEKPRSSEKPDSSDAPVELETGKWNSKPRWPGSDKGLKRAELEDLSESDKRQIISDYIDQHSEALKKRKGRVGDPFFGYMTDGDEVPVETHIEGHRVTYSDNPQAKEAMKRLAMDVLTGKIPKGLWDSSEGVHITHQAFSTERAKKVAGEIGAASFTAAAVATARGVNFFNGEVRRETFAHELGHNLARKVWGLSQAPPVGSPYANTIKSEGYVSDYSSRWGKRDEEKGRAEDFADSCKMFVASPEELQRRFPRKYAIVADLIRRAEYSEET